MSLNESIVEDAALEWFGELKIDVRFEDETVWFKQQHMAELFQTTKQNVGQHLKSIFAEGEMMQNSVVKDSFTTAPTARTTRPDFTISMPSSPWATG